MTASLSGGRRRAPRAAVRSLPDRRRDRRARRRAACRASSGSRPAWASPGPGTWPARWQRCPSRPCSSTASRSRGTTSGSCRSPTRKACLERVLPPRGVTRYGDHVEGAGAGLPRGGGRGPARGHRGQAGGEPLHGRALGRVAQDQVPAPAGVRDRRLHRSRRAAARRFGALHLGRLRRAIGSSTCRRSARASTAPSSSGSGSGSSRSAGTRRRSTPARRRGADTTGSSRGSSARCGSPSGRGTAGFATPPTSGSGTTSARRSAVARRRTPATGRTTRPRRHPASRPSGGPRQRPRAEAGGREATARRPAGEAGAPPGSRVRLTNLDKVFWPPRGTRRATSSRTTTRSRRRLLPYLRDRPIVLTRYPDGIAGKSFFQKDAPDFAPDWVRTERIYSKDTDRDIDYFVVDDAETLRYVANMGTIPIHVWSARVADARAARLARPRPRPEGRAVHRRRARRAGAPSPPRRPRAAELREDVRRHAGSTSWCPSARGTRTSRPGRWRGSSPRWSSRRCPTSRPSPVRSAARGGKVYVDFGQNGHGQTIVAPFSVRPLPGAPVSCPLRLGGGHRAARSGPLHDPHRAAPLRATRRTRWRRSSERESTWPPRSRRMEGRLEPSAPAGRGAARRRQVRSTTTPAAGAS